MSNESKEKMGYFLYKELSEMVANGKFPKGVMNTVSFTQGGALLNDSGLPSFRNYPVVVENLADGLRARACAKCVNRGTCTGPVLLTDNSLNNFSAYVTRKPKESSDAFRKRVGKRRCG